MANKYHMDSLEESEHVCDTNDRIVAFPTAKEFMNAFADAGDDKTQLAELKENAEKLLKRYPGTDEENKEQIFALINEVLTYEYTDDTDDDTDEHEDPCNETDNIYGGIVIIDPQQIDKMRATSGNDDTDESKDPCEKFDDINYEAALILTAYQRIEMMHATYDHADTLEIIDDAVEIELIQTESTKELKGWNTSSCTLVKILDESVDTQFFGYNMCDLSVHKKIMERWLTDSEKEEYSRLTDGSKFNECPMDTEEGTFIKIEAYNILAATRLAKNILNTDY